MWAALNAREVTEVDLASGERSLGGPVGSDRPTVRCDCDGDGGRLLVLVETWMLGVEMLEKG